MALTTSLTVSDIEQIRVALAKNRLPLHDEKRTQAAIEAVFLAEGIEHTRECALSRKHTIDFMVGTIGVEVKIKGSAAAIYRQLCAYAGYPEVESILLLTATSMTLPPSINNKPATVFNIAKNWL